MMEDHDCHARLLRVFREVLEDPTLQIRDTDTADDIPGWDSVAHVNLIVCIEEDFDVIFSTEDIAACISVGDIKRVILSQSR